MIPKIYLLIMDEENCLKVTRSTFSSYQKTALLITALCSLIVFFLTMWDFKFMQIYNNFFLAIILLNAYLTNYQIILFTPEGIFNEGTHWPWENIKEYKWRETYPDNLQLFVETLHKELKIAPYKITVPDQFKDAVQRYLESYSPAAGNTES